MIFVSSIKREISKNENLHKFQEKGDYGIFTIICGTNQNLNINLLKTKFR